MLISVSVQLHMKPQDKLLIPPVFRWNCLQQNTRWRILESYYVVWNWLYGLTSNVCILHHILNKLEINAHRNTGLLLFSSGGCFNPFGSSHAFEKLTCSTPKSCWIHLIFKSPVVAGCNLEPIYSQLIHLVPFFLRLFTLHLHRKRFLCRQWGNYLLVYCFPSLPQSVTTEQTGTQFVGD